MIVYSPGCGVNGVNCVWAGWIYIYDPSNGNFRCNRNSGDTYDYTTAMCVTQAKSNGNLQAANDLITAANNQSFAYDPLNRLSSATGPNNFAYTYDNVGNRTSDYKNNAETIYNYDPGSQKLLSQSVGLKSPVIIDNAGDAVFSRLNTYNYDPDQRLNSMQQGKNILGAYSYDSQGRRVAKTTGAGSTYFDYNPQGHLLDESGPGLSTDYVYLDGETLARVDYNLYDTTGNVAGWNIAYYHNNQVATPIKTTDRLGNVSWSGQLDPFGTVLPINANITQNLRFPGQYYDAETNLLYNNQRYYDAQSGRYLQSDRIGLDGGINTYTYAGNNPLRYTDPLGLDYWGNYLNFVNQYLIDPTVYASPLLLGAPIPKSWVGASPLLGSKNPLTSPARALGIPGAKSAICRTAVFPLIGLGLVGVGTYNSAILVNGLFQATDQ